jgi:hypothetical protein
MTRWAWLVLIVLTAAAALTMPHLTLAGSNDPKPGVHPPTLLWQAFPLRQRPAQTHTRARVTPNIRPSRAIGPSERLQPGDRHDGTQNWWWFPAGTLWFLAGTIAAVAILLLRSRHEGGSMGKFRLTRPAVQKNDLDNRKAVSAGHGDGPVAERVTRSVETAPSAPSDSEQSRVTEGEINIAHLGTHLQSVLSAAEEAAVRIQEEAREEAERMRQHAKSEAAACAESARHEADAAKAEAQRLRSDAEKWCEEARTAAENNASDRRAEAEVEAREILMAAERQTASLKQEAERRYKTLTMDIGLAEDRLRELATALHDLAERLDNLLLGPSGEEEEGDLAVGSDDSLVDALAPSPSSEEAPDNGRSSSWG